MKIHYNRLKVLGYLASVLAVDCHLHNEDGLRYELVEQRLESEQRSTPSQWRIQAPRTALFADRTADWLRFGCKSTLVCDQEHQVKYAHIQEI